MAYFLHKSVVSFCGASFPDSLLLGALPLDPAGSTASNPNSCPPTLNDLPPPMTKTQKTRMWANAQRDGRPAEYRWRPLFNAAKFG